MIGLRRLGGVCLVLLLSGAAVEPSGAGTRFVVPQELVSPPAPATDSGSGASVAGSDGAVAENQTATPPSPAARAPAAPLQIDPAKSGYAFETPAVLVRQLVFGLAHGVTLLARACLDDDEEVRRPTQAAYEEWLMRYADRIIDAEQTLARYYFGERAEAASEDDIARALNLPAQLELRKPETLREACTSFPEALSRKRYDLDVVFATHRDEQRLSRALEVRELLSQCRQIAEVEALPVMDAAFARWEKINAKIENVARARWLRYRGDIKNLERWQDDVRTRVRRSFAQANSDPKPYCASLTERLDGPENSLAQLIGGANTEVDAELVDGGDPASE